MTTSTAVSSNTPTIQELGLGSNLDVTSIINALVQNAQIPENQLANEVSTDQSEVSAYGQLSSALSSFQSSLTSLQNASTFQSLQASVANSAVASASVSTTTGTGAPSAATHTLSVSQLAQNQIVASSDFSSTTSTVGTGTITIQAGTWSNNNTTFTPNPNVAAQTITIGSSNSSLTGVVQAINTAGAGVSASIVNDGTGSRLVLSGNNTGAANGFSVTVANSGSDSSGSSGLSAIAFDPASTGGTPQTTLLQSSQDANFNVDGIAITSASNTATNAIQGITLNLQSTTTVPTTLTVSQSTASANSAIQSFVSSYNSLQSTISSLTTYNSSTSTAGPLNADPNVTLISNDLQNVVANIFSTADPGIQTVADLGMTFQETGSITLNQATLTAALSSDPAAVAQLFETAGTASDSLVSYQGSTSATQAGSYALNVSQLATEGSLSGSQAAGLTITQGSNDTLNLTIDGTKAAVTIPAGTYASASALATAVQSAINSNPTFTKAGVNVNVASSSGGVLTVTDSVYGSASRIAVTGGDGASNLFGASPTATAGLDVAGTLGGVAFTGQGQVATGASGSAAAGLGITIAGGSTGSRGTVTFTQGIAAQLNSSIANYLDPTTGIIANATSSIKTTITSLQTQETAMQASVTALQANLESEFTAMDELVAGLNSTSQYLTEEFNGSSSGSSSSSSGSSGSSAISTN
jgi:flagellar hook-associated protein 2